MFFTSNSIHLTGAIANFLSVASALQQQQAKTSSSNTVPTTMHTSIAQSIQEQDLLQQQRDLASSNLSKLAEQGEGHEGNTDPSSRSPSFTRYSSPSPNNSASAMSSSFLANANMTATNANMLQGKSIKLFQPLRQSDLPESFHHVTLPILAMNVSVPVKKIY